MKIMDLILTPGSLTMHVVPTEQIVKWQRISMMCALITLLSVGGLTYVATKATFIPYVVSVDESTGRVHSLGALTEVKQEPTDAQKAYFLSRFVEKIRSIPNDSDVLKENMSRATKFMTSESGEKFKNLYLSDMTKRIATGEKNRVKILSVTRVANSDDSYQVRWEESRPTTGGQAPIVHSFTGTFTLTKEAVNDKEVLVDNPLGLFIRDFTMSDEGETKKDNQ